MKNGYHKRSDRSRKTIGNSIKQPFNKGTRSVKPNESVNFDGEVLSRQDPFWYAVDEKAIENMASFPFLQVVGDKIGQSQDQVAGLMQIKHRHCISNTINGTSLSTNGNYATRAAKTYYNYVTQGFTGAVDFEAPDLLMSALAANSLFALLIEGKRAYAALNYYLQFNKYYASSIVGGLGFSYDSLVANKANFRTEFNIRVRQINKLLAVPKKFFIGDRWEFLAGNLFLDTNSPEYSTLMAYICDGYLMYDATAAKTGTCLRWYPGGDFTYQSYFDTIDRLMSALDDDDVRSMFGAIRRVYSESDLKQATELEEGIELAIVKNDVMNATVHNMSWTGTATVSGVNNIIGYLPIASSTSGNELYDAPVYQDTTGNIICGIYQRQNGFIPYSGGAAEGSNGDKRDVLLDMYDHMVTPANVLDITSNIQVSLVDDPNISVTIGSTAYKYTVLRARSEVITAVNMVVMNDNGDGYVLRSVAKGGGTPYPISYGNAAFFHVDSHPLICVSSATSPTFESDIQFYLGEIDKYTLLSRRDVAQLHDRCMYNMLLLPENTKSVTK